MTVEEITDYETEEVDRKKVTCDHCGHEIPKDRVISSIIDVRKNDNPLAGVFGELQLDNTRPSVGTVKVDKGLTFGDVNHYHPTCAYKKFGYDTIDFETVYGVGPLVIGERSYNTDEEPEMLVALRRTSALYNVVSSTVGVYMDMWNELKDNLRQAAVLMAIIFALAFVLNYL